MLKHILISAALLGSAATFQAQTEKSPRAAKSTERAEARDEKKEHTPEIRAALATRRLASKLNFTNQQQSQSIEILTEREIARDKFKASKKDESAKTEWKKARRTANEKMKGMMTDEQKTKWEELKAEKKAQKAKDSNESDEEFHNFEE